MYICHEKKLKNPYCFERGKLDTKRYHHWHEYLEILLILSDGTEGVVEGQRVRFRRGELLLFPPYCLHCIYCDQPEGADVCLIQCWENFLLDTAYTSVAGTKKQFMRCFLPFLNPSLTQIAEFFMTAAVMGDTSTAKHWIRMLADMICRYGDAEQISAPRGTDYGHDLRSKEDMIAVCRYISDHIRDKLTVPELASRAGYSVSHFSRIFHKNIGCSPGEYITRVKVREAQMLLCSSRQSVTEVAYCLNFSNPNNFSRTYRRILGHSPNKDRVEGKKEGAESLRIQINRRICSIS